MTDWHPDAIRQPLVQGVYVGGGEPKLLWHTTEGSSYPGPGIYHGTNPHFTLDFKRGRLYQHVPLSRSSCALVHEGGQTNNDNVIQVELVCFSTITEAAKYGHKEMAVANLTRSDWKQIAALGRWIEKNHGVARKAVSFAHPVRMSWPAWHAYSGHLGHVHAPENYHTDPGTDFRIDLVLGDPRLAKWRARLARVRGAIAARKAKGLSSPGQTALANQLKKLIRKYR